MRGAQYLSLISNPDARNAVEAEHRKFGKQT
jgi:hypothetical protein